jgi:hypothetical protein
MSLPVLLNRSGGPLDKKSQHRERRWLQDGGRHRKFQSARERYTLRTGWLRP